MYSMMQRGRTLAVPAASWIALSITSSPRVLSVFVGLLPPLLVELESSASLALMLPVWRPATRAMPKESNRDATGVVRTPVCLAAVQSNLTSGVST